MAPSGNKAPSSLTPVFESTRATRLVGPDWAWKTRGQGGTGMFQVFVANDRLVPAAHDNKATSATMRVLGTLTLSLNALEQSTPLAGQPGQPAITSLWTLTGGWFLLQTESRLKPPALIET